MLHDPPAWAARNVDRRESKQPRGRLPEGAYGHAVLARQGVARVLAEIAEDGYLTEADALALVPKLLHDNAAGLFGLSDRLAG